jgi:RNase H
VSFDVEVCSDSAYSINCTRTWAANWEKKDWKKPGSEIKNLEIIQDCYAIYRRIEAELKLSHVAAHVGTEGNELADRMAMLGAQLKEKKLRLYQETIDIPTLLKMRAGVNRKALARTTLAFRMPYGHEICRTQCATSETGGTRRTVAVVEFVPLCASG